MEELTKMLLVLEPMFKFAIDHLEGVAGTLSLILALKIFIQSNADRKLEIYMNLFHDWDELWSKITSHPEQNKVLFKKEISEISKNDENLRFTIFQIIGILSRVFYYYEKTNQDMKKSDWHKEALYTMKQPLFRTAYLKHQHRHSEKFKKYIHEILKEIKVDQNSSQIESTGGYMSVDRVQAFRENFDKIKSIAFETKKKVPVKKD